MQKVVVRGPYKDWHDGSKDPIHWYCALIQGENGNITYRWTRDRTPGDGSGLEYATDIARAVAEKLACACEVDTWDTPTRILCDATRS